MSIREGRDFFPEFYFNQKRQNMGSFLPEVIGVMALFHALQKESHFFNPPLQPSFLTHWQKRLKDLFREARDEAVPKKTASASPAPEKGPHGLRLTTNNWGDWLVEPHIAWHNDRLSAAKAYFAMAQTSASLNESSDFFADLHKHLIKDKIPVFFMPPGKSPVRLKAGNSRLQEVSLLLDRQMKGVALKWRTNHSASRKNPFLLIFDQNWALTREGLLQPIQLPPIGAALLSGPAAGSTNKTGETPIPVLPPGPLLISREDFHRGWSSLATTRAKSPSEGLFFAQSGKIIPQPPLRKAHIGVSWNPGNDQSTVEPMLMVRWGKRSLSLAPLHEAPEPVRMARRYHRLFREEERRKKILRALLELLQDSSLQDRRQHLKELNEQDWGGPGIQRDMREFLNDFAPLLPTTRESLPWIFLPEEKLSPSRVPFLRSSLSSARIWTARLLIAWALGGPDMIPALCSSLWHSLPREELGKLAEKLLPLAKEYDVDIFLDQQPLRFETVDFGLRFQRIEDRQDWFAVHPEFFAQGHLLEENDWKDLLQKGCSLQTDGRGFLLRQLSESPQNREGLARWESYQKDPKKGVSRLQIFDWLELRRGGLPLQLPPAEDKILSSLAGFQKIPETTLPSSLRANLRPYQKEGFDWLSFLYQHRFGACLADDMGLGKTLQSIAFLLALREGLIPSAPGAQGPHLLILPASLVFNWQAELEHFAPSLRVREYRGQQRKADFSGFDIVLTTYDTARRDADLLSRQSFHVLLLDEAQAAKNSSSARYRKIRKIPANFRLCLTGTPVENHLREFRAILELALPGLFQDLQENNREALKSPEVLSRRSAPFILRRTKSAVLKDLPPKEERYVILEMSPRQKALYLREAARVRSDIAEAFAQKEAAQAGIIALAALNRLRQLCVHPRLLRPTEKTSSPKMEFMTDLLHELREEGHACLVFSQYVRALDLAEETLRKENLPFLRLDGKTSARHRQERVQSFQKGEEAGIFLISLKAGGVGLNLTRASYVLHLDPWWNPAVENQASDRAHRIGQKQRVLVQKLVMRETVEEKIVKLKEEKARLFTRILGSDKAPERSGGLRREDFAYLLGEEPAITSS